MFPFPSCVRELQTPPPAAAAAAAVPPPSRQGATVRQALSLQAVESSLD